jgi:hypothetical protein
MTIGGVPSLGLFIVRAVYDLGLFIVPAVVKPVLVSLNSFRGLDASSEPLLQS